MPISKPDYHYNRQLSPPAPIVLLTLSTKNAPNPLRRIPGLIDTGADRTLIPIEFIANLNCSASDEIQIMGFSGTEIIDANTYFVNVAFEGHQAVRIEVVGIEGEEYAIIGRDFLNNFKIILDGPNLELTIVPNSK